MSERGEVVFLGNVRSAALEALYSVAAAFLFPSLEEGFGWPLIEAQACGCPVITTARPPMSEVAGDAACYLPRLQSSQDIDSWALQGGIVLEKLIAESPAEKAVRKRRGQEWASRFGADRAIDEYLTVYASVLAMGAVASAASRGGGRT